MKMYYCRVAWRGEVWVRAVVLAESKESAIAKYKGRHDGLLQKLDGHTLLVDVVDEFDGDIFMI